MAVQPKSAQQLIQKKEASLEEGLKLLIGEDKALNSDYLDSQLVSSMKPGWPKEKAVPLVFAEKKLFVACAIDEKDTLIETLKPMVNNIPIELMEVKKESLNSPAPAPKQEASAAAAPEAPKKKNTLGSELLATLDQIESRSINATDENAIGNEVKMLMAKAAKIGCSDIHFEPLENALIARFRIDGVLRDIYKYPCTKQADYRKILIARIKIIADLNIAESRIPQDGRVTENVDGMKLDLRVSTLPCLHGEKCVIRLLPHENSFLELSDLGMTDDLIPEFEGWLGRSQGMVLITGPTGSGKTSTLYTSLAKLVDTTKNVVTVEDPVEFQLARVNQVQVNAKAGLTFAAGLRSILRQDPDIVMIGEIRDRETAEIAIKASLTGHLVLSTLHTNGAAETVVRLIDMGVEPYLASSALVGVAAQRLLRRVCKDCAEDYKPTEKELKVLGKENDPEKDKIILSRGKGCQNCNNTGYSGREGIFEVMPVNSEMKEIIQKNADIEAIKAIMERENMTTLYDHAVKKVLMKKSTVEELLRVADKSD